MTAIFDGIAALYLWLWHSVFQRAEPWTPQLCRMALKWPEVIWPGTIALLAWMGLVASTGHVWQRVVSILILLFYCWFIPHVIDYIRHHPENQPYLKVWAENRLQARAERNIDV